MFFGVSADLYRAAREDAVVLNRSHHGRLVVSGADRRSYLQGLLTNDIVALKAGEGCYAAYLTAQGRMIADLYVYEIGDIILLRVPRAVKDVVLGKLEQFIFSEDVRVGDVTSTFEELGVLGPRAGDAVAAVLSGAPVETLHALREHGNLRATFSGEPVIVTRTADAGEPGFDLYIEQAHLDRLRSTVMAHGVRELDAGTAEAIRIEAGIPRFGDDMDEDTIPLEAGIESRAISLTKGCYVGQEVIIRVLHRGHGRVARRLVGFVWEGQAPPAAQTRVRAGENEIGLVTSSAMSPALGRPIGLGYVQRDFTTPGTAIESLEGQPGVVAALPFVGKKPD